MKSMAVGDDLIFAVEHRGGDGGGPSLHLMVRMPPDPPHRETRHFVQVWRVDCFSERSHQHWFGPQREQIFDLDPSDVVGSVDRCLSQLDNILGIVLQAGYTKPPAHISRSVPDNVIRELREWMLEV